MQRREDSSCSKHFQRSSLCVQIQNCLDTRICHSCKDAHIHSSTTQEQKRTTTVLCSICSEKAFFSTRFSLDAVMKPRSGKSSNGVLERSSELDLRKKACEISTNLSRWTVQLSRWTVGVENVQKSWRRIFFVSSLTPYPFFLLRTPQINITTINNDWKTKSSNARLWKTGQSAL